MEAEEEVKSDVEEMNKAFESVIKEVEPEPEPKVEPKVDPKSEPEVDPEPESDPIVDPEPDPDPEPTSDPEPDPIPEVDERDEIIAELRRKLDEKETKEEPETKEEEKVKEEESPAFETQEFLAEDEDLENLIRDPKKLNEVFNKVYQKAVTDTRKTLGEGVLRSIPDIVRASVDMIDKLKEMNTKFYSDNKDLKPFQKVVAAVFEEVATEHPGKDMMDILPMVADEARKKLELHKQATKKPERKSPRLPSRKSRMTIVEDKPNTDPLLNELEEMNKSLRR